MCKPLVRSLHPSDDPTERSVKLDKRRDLRGILGTTVTMEASSKLHDYIPIAAPALHEFMRFGNPVERQAHGDVVLKPISGEE
jgi:hypothetical protein